MAERIFAGTSTSGRHTHSRTSDVWRTALLLQCRVPDLQIDVCDTGPTGLVCITNLASDEALLANDYAAYTREMIAESLDAIAIETSFAPLGVESTCSIRDRHGMLTRCWL